MGFKKYLLILFFLITTTLFAFAQQDSIPLTSIVSKVEKFSTDHPFEKVYLHFDKPYYAVNDTIWFKAYLTVGPLHEPSGLSRIIYVDMINSQDSIIRALKLPVINGVAFGDISLIKQLYKQGNYRIRAYTNWMRNFGPDYFFNKTISIGDAAQNAVTAKVFLTKTEKDNRFFINAKLLYKNRDGNPNADKKINWTVKNETGEIKAGKSVTDKNGFATIYFQLDEGEDFNNSNLITVIETGSRKPVTNSFSLRPVFATTDVQFFPEGGDLISGVRSKIAFKAVDLNGMGINVTGSVVDNTGTEVAVFTSQHAGMGIFALLPQNNKTYKAIVTFPDGTKNTFDLPNVRPDGINLSVNNSDPDSLGIKIATNAEYFKRYQNQGIYIVAQNGGTIYYAGLAPLQSLVYTASVPKSKFPTGVLQVTLFASNGDPLSERVVFVQRNDALDMALTANKQVYTSKQHVNITLSAKSNAIPVEGSFSVAVVDETKVPFDEDAETTILSSLLLTSDLRGYIERPNYYFNHINSDKLADLDILMLTQGYRRFSYSEILANKYPAIKFLPEKGMTVSGTLRKNSGVPVFKGAVNLSLPSRNISVNGYTDADGRFAFANVSVFDSAKVVLSARNNTGGSSMIITADKPSLQPIKKGVYDPYQINDIDSALSTYLQNSKLESEHSHVLNEVVIKGTRKVVTPDHPTYSILNGLSGIADQTINAERLKNCSSVLTDCILNVVSGINKIDDKYYILRHYAQGSKSPIQFFVNGDPVDYPYLSQMDPANVQSIEVYFKDGFTGINHFYKADGIISITTKGGKFNPEDEKSTDLQPLTVQTSEITFMPKGYYRARLFYSPKYDNLANSAQQGIDLRTTIYWVPNIITDKNGVANFDYYNADGKGTYRVIIEGIDNDGNIGRYTMRYNVK